MHNEETTGESKPLTHTNQKQFRFHTCLKIHIRIKKNLYCFYTGLGYRKSQPFVTSRVYILNANL